MKDIHTPTPERDRPSETATDTICSNNRPKPKMDCGYKETDTTNPASNHRRKYKNL